MSQQPLSLRLREGTHDAHRQAESTPFIREFFAGRLTWEAYRTFLAQLYQVYTALEARHEQHREHPVLGGLYFPELQRAGALADDLNYYFEGDAWRAAPVHPATERYVARLGQVAAEWPAGLAAHHYTRYLGDLSGGQALRKLVAKMFSLADGRGLAFYDFPAIPHYGQFKDAYRARLDSLPVDEAGAQALVDEANHAFALNRGVFADMLAAAQTNAA